MITRILLLSTLLFQAGIASAHPAGPETTRTQRRTGVGPAADDLLRATPFRYTKKPKSTSFAPAGTSGGPIEFKRLVIE
ncbi:MAG: hypothetical protein IPG10_04165 [Flavobacteriales bacterium]|jgi:hypothetical protein|nr:hypothetical protein [Flavobacteriales bacterium]MBK7084384.1 hypothetical protein [Flavobacteriales bacterium]MBK7267990.1 hypothetical protein [Flavobacteriales bacterium]MBK7751350.1 hypothetical protein [Flavobacteriales bacterium]MBK9073696.1 hypothetical protein [Flavobacteriales bacterium]